MQKVSDIEQLKSENFILRRLRASDFDAYYNNINDKKIGINMRSIDYPYPKKDAKELFSKILHGEKGYEDFVIDVDGECAGMIGLSNIIPKHSAKVHYWIGKRHRGKGITTKAVKIIVKYGIKKYKLVRIYANVVTKNIASVRVLEKSKFKLEGIQKKNRLKNGKYYDDYLYAFTR